MVVDITSRRKNAEAPLTFGAAGAFPFHRRSLLSQRGHPQAQKVIDGTA
jgi:hypothetical protein